MREEQVAMQLGYEDCSYFNKLFKSYAGMTPMEYREQHLFLQVRIKGENG